MMLTEIWKLTDSHYKIYTERKILKGRLAKIFDTIPGEIHILKGVEIGWGFTFEKKFLPTVRKEVKNAEKKACKKK